MTKSEQVARAMWEQRRKFAAGHHPPVLLEEWGDGSIPAANGIMEEAHAAIEAMREPDEAMQTAVSNSFLYQIDPEHVVHWLYPRMIDAARAEGAA